MSDFGNIVRRGLDRSDGLFMVSHIVSERVLFSKHHYVFKYDDSNIIDNSLLNILLQLEMNFVAEAD